MVLENKIYAAQMRLMRHYADVVRDANQVYDYGGDNSVHALSILDSEWAQIDRCRAWLAEQGAINDDAAALLISMAYGGRTILGIRLTASESLTWYEHALAAAERLGDTGAASSHLISIGMALLFLGNLEQALEPLFQACAVAEQHGHWQQLAGALHKIAVIKQDMGELDAAADAGERALECYRRISDISSISSVLVALGAIAKRQGQWAKAEGYIQESYAIALRSGDYAAISLALQTLGQLMRQVGRHAEAVAYQTQALEFSLYVGDQRNAIITMMDLAGSYDNEGNFTESREFYLRALDIAQRTGQARVEAILFGNLGYSAYLQENFTDCVHYTEESLNLLRAQKQIYMVCMSLANIIPAYLPLGEIDQACHALYEGLELATNLDAEPLKVTMLVAAVQTWVALAHRETNLDDQNTLLSSAAHWSGLILVYPSAEQENRDEINKLLPDMVSGLGTEQVDRLLQQGVKLNIDEVIVSVLKELETLA